MDTAVHQQRERFGIVAVGFGTAVTMWAAGYFTHLPGVSVPAPVVFILLLGTMLGGGWLAGMLLQRGWLGGLYSGLVTGLLNLLILGSLIGGDKPNSVMPSMAVWVPGALLACAAVGALGAAIGSRKPVTLLHGPRWTSVLARVDAAAILLLILAGGVVTSAEAGLAVVDWPNSFGYNMFLYPLSRMTGGIYYEHSHRLIGTLVGLTTIVLALRLQLTVRPRWQKWLGWSALLLIIIQGILGGLRVTGVFTLSTSPEDVAPSITLAIVHGVLGQLVFGVVISLAAVTSATWKRLTSAPLVANARADIGLGTALVIALVVQLLLGALLRHIFWGLWLHIGFAVVVLTLLLVAGSRALARAADYRPIPRVGGWLMVLGGVQLLLGLSAYFAIGLAAQAPSPPVYMVVLATVHQTVGAVLLALAVILLVFSLRLLRAAPAAAAASAPSQP